MYRLKCDVSDGPREGFKEVGVQSIEGHKEYLAIEARFLIPSGGGWFLPVRTIARDPRHNTVLVQLPVEADSGANRVWVKEAILSDTLGEAMA
jgi:hypothetical protein